MIKTISFKEKYPIISSVVLTFFLILMTFIAGMVSAISSISSQVSFFAAFSFVGLVLLIDLKLTKKWHYYGFMPLSKIPMSHIKVFLPVFFLAIMPLVFGFSSDLSFNAVLYIIIYMGIVAFVEETIFRGIIFDLLKSKGKKYAIIGSSVLFAMAHLINILSGKLLIDIIFQFAFALLIGLILGLFVWKTNNIILPIGYHFLNNTISSFTRSTSALLSSRSLTLMMLIMGCLYASYLFYDVIIKKRLTDK